MTASEWTSSSGASRHRRGRSVPVVGIHQVEVEGSLDGVSLRWRPSCCTSVRVGRLLDGARDDRVDRLLLEPRVPSPKFVKEYPIVRTIGVIRKTERKKVPGKRYLPGTKRFVEYRTKIAIAARIMHASHIQDCLEIMHRYGEDRHGEHGTEHRSAYHVAGTVVDRSDAQARGSEVMRRLCLSGISRGSRVSRAGWGRTGSEQIRRGQQAGRAAAGAAPDPSRRRDQPIDLAVISSPAESIVESGSAPPTMFAWACPAVARWRTSPGWRASAPRIGELGEDLHDARGGGDLFHAARGSPAAGVGLVHLPWRCPERTPWRS